MSGGSIGWRKLLASAKPSVGVPGLPDFRGLSCADAVIFIPRIFRDSRHRAASGGTWLHGRSAEGQSVCAAQAVFRLIMMGWAWAPPAGFEPALTAPEAVGRHRV